MSLPPEVCDQHGRSLDHVWGCFGCALAEWLAEDPFTHEPLWKPIGPVRAHVRRTRLPSADGRA